MKTIQVLILCAAITLIITSCKKSPTDPTSPVSYKIKTYSEDLFKGGVHTKDSVNITYNANDQISLYLSILHPGFKIVYSYQTNTFFQDFYFNNSLEIHTVNYVKNNLLDSMVQTDAGFTSSTKFIYNGLNQLVTQKEYDITGGQQLVLTITYNYDAAGNMVKQTDTDDNTLVKTYYTDQLDQTQFLVPYYKWSKNLVKTDTSSNPSAGYLQTTTHTYTFDNLKRVIKEEAVANNGESYVRGYTYY